MTFPRRVTLAAAALLLLAGCGAGPAASADGDPAATAPAAAYNDADVMFLQMMINHHGQGVEMAQLAEQRGSRQEVKLLAAAVVTTQTDEIGTMKSWLQEWGEPTDVDRAPSAHAAHGGLPATGETELAALKTATGRQFEQQFLNLFVGHQHNAIEMARAEATDGASPQAKELATRIERSRAGQIQQMLGLISG
ncbi:Uncharacterized conserved protein, DUF305 family [Micromonospora pattaloongensis]|uniref:Uncharacterized conserved protein, DUF305 family n=1 Tax=Micromonospora pattaloongensis TaxID=405436 RepID=A0A1H3RXB3_9ACTN|nr:DUF305 domain-containing protein [Micromonospora pattaloongensis]SDZ29958.1 Uncharacterized conserved protein, DUF305 family [Micromonospora pattaloongensis]